MCDILLKCLIHILKAHDISSWKIQEKIEIITNHFEHYWTKIPKNGYCDFFDNYDVLNFLKMCPIFVSAVLNFCKSADDIIY